MSWGGGGGGVVLFFLTIVAATGYQVYEEPDLSELLVNKNTHVIVFCVEWSVHVNCYSGDPETFNVSNVGRTCGVAQASNLLVFATRSLVCASRSTIQLAQNHCR